MDRFPWDPRLETGDPDIDDQHRRLFELANTLQSTCDEFCDEHDMIGDAVYSLVEYAVEHFADEEAFMERCSYPQTWPHRALHAHMSARITQLAANYMNGQEPAPETIAQLATDWLSDHILAEDMQLVEYARRGK